MLVTGPTGSGKSTTLAAMIDKINTERREHIITIEDPIEYIHQHKGCLVNQREVHADTLGFAAALRAALREDPDIVLIGEMRDLETIESALRIAETGHLTFATLHTNSAAQTINRIIDVFPAHQQGQIRTQLSLVLEGIVCQALLPRADGKGRVVSLEIMVPTPAIRNLIRDDKVHQIYSTMQAGQEKLGMQTMNQNLVTLYQKRLITLETAMTASSQKDELEQMISRGAGVVAGAGLQPPRRRAADGGRGQTHRLSWQLERASNREPLEATVKLTGATMPTFAYSGRTRAGQTVTRRARRRHDGRRGLRRCGASRSWSRGSIPRKRRPRPRPRRRSRTRRSRARACRRRTWPSSPGSSRS